MKHTSANRNGCLKTQLIDSGKRFYENTYAMVQSISVLRTECKQLPTIVPFPQRKQLSNKFFIYAILFQEVNWGVASAGVSVKQAAQLIGCSRSGVQGGPKVNRYQESSLNCVT